MKFFVFFFCLLMGFCFQGLYAQKQQLSNNTMSIGDDSTSQKDTLVNAMDEVVVRAKTNSEKIEDKGYAVQSIGLKKLKDLKRDALQVLDNSPGVRIRQNGGFGSDYEFSLNGLSGHRVRFFVDGIPIDYLGEGYRLYNLPINSLERIDIYKGVVPVALGSDALAGAVHLVSEKRYGSFLDVSYEYGSFATSHLIANTQYRNQTSGFTFRPKFFYNYSDNNYVMKDMSVYVDGRFQDFDVERFHDTYTSQTASVELGFTHTNWADALLLSYTDSKIEDAQQTDFFNNPLGEVREDEHDKVLTLQYRKSDLLNGKLGVKLFGVYNEVNAVAIDTSSNKYNWLGEVFRVANDNTGEIQNNKTIFEYKQQSKIVRTNFNYELRENQNFTLNYVGAWLQRQGENRIRRTAEEPFQSPNTLEKHVTGIGYDSSFLEDRWTLNLALKYFQFDIATKSAIYDLSSGKTVLDAIRAQREKYGYSIASRYRIHPSFFIKTSFETGVRLPELLEIFGNGMSVDANPNLLPESSNNLNLGLNYSTQTKQGKFSTQCNLFYRDVKNYIQKVPSAKRSIYINVRDVLIYGFEGGAKYSWGSRGFVEASFTNQQVLNNEKYDAIGRENRIYRDKLPNQPYMFGNIGGQYNFLDVAASSKLSLNYQLHYVHGFFRSYESISTAFQKNITPTQLTNDIACVLSLKDNTYTLTLGVTNLFDAVTFDNFLIQKPGRAFHVKLRYTI